MNEAVGGWSQCEKGAGKTWFVREISKNSSGNALGVCVFGSYLWDKRMQYWGKSHEYDHGRMTGKIKKEVRGKTHLLKVSCYLHHFNFCSYRHLNMLSYTNVSIYWMSLCMLTSLFFISLCCVLHKFQRIITPCLYSFCREFFLVTREKLIKEWPGIVLK